MEINRIVKEKIVITPASFEVTMTMDEVTALTKLLAPRTAKLDKVDGIINTFEMFEYFSRMASTS